MQLNISPFRKYYNQDLSQLSVKQLMQIPVKVYFMLKISHMHLNNRNKLRFKEEGHYSFTLNYCVKTFTYNKQCKIFHLNKAI
jgi:hypothetical protein